MTTNKGLKKTATPWRPAFTNNTEEHELNTYNVIQCYKRKQRPGHFLM